MEKKKVEKKVGKVMEILRKEYPFEGLLLGLLGILVLILGVYIFEGRILRIRLDNLWIFATTLRIQIFSIIVIIIGIAAILIATAPFLFPAMSEMKRVSWPNRNTMLNHTARVFGFIIFLGIMFIIYDAVFSPIFEAIIPDPLSDIAS